MSYIYVSDRAYDKLIQDAYSLDYIRSSTRATGIEFYIKALCAPHVIYDDRRPEHILSTDQWCTGIDSPRKRLVKISPETTLRLAILALEFGIAGFRSQRAILNGQRVYITHESAFANPSALVGPVLEAIGIGWLRPSGVDRAPVTLWRMSTAAWKKQTKYRKSQRHGGSYSY